MDHSNKQNRDGINVDIKIQNKKKFKSKQKLNDKIDI